MSGYRVQIDRSVCSGMASCVKIAPATFDLDGQGIAVLTGAADASAVEAAECCPLGAIAVFDEATGEQVV
jgi:ferredoxin